MSRSQFGELADRILAAVADPLPCDRRPTPASLQSSPPSLFAEFKPNEFIPVVKNPDYWKPGRPYLDGIEWTIISNRSTQTLAFIAGKFDMSFPHEVTVQSMRDIQNQAPNAICEMTPTPVAMNLLVNRDAAPFNDPDIRRAMQLTIDRKSFLDISRWYRECVSLLSDFSGFRVVCRARGTRFAVAQDARRDDPGLTRTRVVSPENSALAAT